MFDNKQRANIMTIFYLNCSFTLTRQIYMPMCVFSFKCMSFAIYIYIINRRTRFHSCHWIQWDNGACSDQTSHHVYKINYTHTSHWHINISERKNWVSNSNKSVYGVRTTDKWKFHKKNRNFVFTSISFASNGFSTLIVLIRSAAQFLIASLLSR